MFNNPFRKTIINAGLRVLLLTNALIMLAGFMLGPIYALFVEDIGGDLLSASTAFAIFAVVAGVAVLGFSIWENKAKRKTPFVVAGYAIMGGGFLSYLFVDSVATLFIVQVIIGLGEALYVPAYDALYTRHISEKDATLQWGIWESMAYVVTGVGALLGGLIAKQFGFDILFIAMGILSLLAAAYVAYANSRQL